MGTKARPGRFDCWHAAEPDEPMFVLLGRDAAAPQLVRSWAWLRRKQIVERTKPPEDEAKVKEAMELADAMEAWRKRRPARRS